MDGWAGVYLECLNGMASDVYSCCADTCEVEIVDTISRSMSDAAFDCMLGLLSMLLLVRLGFHVILYRSYSAHVVMWLQIGVEFMYLIY